MDIKKYLLILLTLVLFSSFVFAEKIEDNNAYLEVIPTTLTKATDYIYPSFIKIPNHYYDK